MQNGTNGSSDEDIPLFNPVLLQEVDFSEHKASFKPMITPTSPGENLLMRPLSTSDYDKGFLKILTQLTSVGEISREKYLERFHGMKDCANTYYIAVIEDTCSGQVIGTGTLFVEQKFIHTAATRGRIEDIVVNSDYRGKQLGKLIVETLTLMGKKIGCYKMSLECLHKNVPFYENFGFIKDDSNNFMVQRYKD